jgi:prepilin-type N-terminal cleavage/methylation domain-containing protein
MTLTRRRQAGFTLIEILVVVAIIVIMIAMAVPLFSTLTGSRSEESAENQIAAMLNTARTEAMALQVPTGVMFYVDPVTNRVNAVLVREVQTEAINSDLATKGGMEMFLDLLDREPVSLPPGIWMQMMDDAEHTEGVTDPKPGDFKDDRYVGFDQIGDPPDTPPSGNPTTIKVGGVILFDARGQLLFKRVAFPYAAKNSNGKWTRTAIAQLMFSRPGTDTSFLDNSGLIAFNKTFPRTQFGLVLFNREAFLGAGHKDDDAQFNRTYDAQEIAEEQWIDANSVPLIVNRYNGTLIRGEP